jgi:hypothetical protein
MTGTEWVKLWGKPDAEVKDKYWKFEYHEGGLDLCLTYLEDDEHIIGFDFAPKGTIDLESAAPVVERYLPEDAVYQYEYGRPYGDPGAVVVYNSAWLANRFLHLNDPVIDDWFTGGNPGDFIVIYQESSEAPGLLGILVGLGNNP